MAATRVLIVDDEEPILNFTSRLLTSAGSEALGTTSPREAVEIVKKESPIDVIVSDVEMPEMAGTELVREVVSISPRIARVLISGAPVESTKIPEGVPVLRKPFVTAELISAVQAVLGRSAQLSDDLYRERQVSAELKQDSKQLISKCAALVQEAAKVLEKSHRIREEIEEEIGEKATGFRDSGVGFKLHSLKENVNATTPSGKLTFQILAALAEFERDILRQRINAGRKAARHGRHRRQTKGAQRSRFVKGARYYVPSIPSTFRLPRTSRSAAMCFGGHRRRDSISKKQLNNLCGCYRVVASCTDLYSGYAGHMKTLLYLL